MDQAGLHAQGVGDLAGVLGAGAAEHGEAVFGDVVALLDRDLLDRVGHVLDRDLEEAVGEVLRALVGLGREGLEFRPGGPGVKRPVGARAEDGGEEFRAQLAGHDIGVGDRQRAAAAVGGRAGVGAGALRADPHAGAVDLQDRAAARRHGVDVHHRRPHPHAGDLGQEHALECARVMADIG